MKDGQNISPLNGLIRIALGFTFLSWAIAQLARKRHMRISYLFIAFCSATKIGSGILRYCPFVAFGKQCLSITTHDICISPIKEFLKEVMDEDESSTQDDDKEAINPS